MNAEEIVRTSQRSIRVRRFAAAAIRYSALRVLGHDMTGEDAHRLALAYTPAEAVDRLRKRLEIQRHVPKAEQQKLATAEVIVDGFRSVGTGVVREAGEISEKELGMYEGITKALLLKEIFGQHDEHAEQLSAAHQVEARLDQLRRRTEDSSRELKRFMRKAARLWSRQRNEVMQKIIDPRMREPALKELGEYYANYLEEAVQIEYEYIQEGK